MNTLVGEQLHFAYRPALPVINDVSLELCGGELLGIIGPNGSGKSTLLRLLAGLLVPRAGSVTVGGRPLRALRRVETARLVAYLPQTVLGAFDFTCAEIVAQGRYAHHGAFDFLTRGELALIRECMAATRCGELAGRRLSELSGGERQRVLLASILAQQARFMLLDEPAAALDLHHQGELFALLWKLKQRDAGVAVVVHDLNLAAEFCDRLLLLQRGRIAAAGTPPEVLNADVLQTVYGGGLIVAQHPVTHKPLITVSPAARGDN